MKIQPFEFNMFGELTYLVWDEKSKEGAVIDPGFSNTDEQNSFDSFVKEHSINLCYQLFTHLHIDHTFGYEHVQEKYGLQAMAHNADSQLGANRAEQAKLFRLSIPVPGSLKIGRQLIDGDVLRLGDEEFIVIEVPGHSQGSVAYYFPKSGFVLTGDALFKGSIGRTDLPGGNHAQLIKSIQTRLLTLPDSTYVLPGHGPISTIGEEKRTNPYV